MRVLTIQERNDFEAAVAESGLTWHLDIHIYERYSGRFMFGETCFGFSVSERANGYYILGLFARNHLDLSAELANACKTDNLGKDYILYFPGYMWSENVNSQATQTAGT